MALQTATVADGSRVSFGLQHSQDKTTRDYVKILFRQKWVIFLTIATVTIATFIGLQLQTPVYEAQVKMLITAEKNIDSPYYREMYQLQKVEAALTQSEIVKSKPVLERAIAALHLHERPMDFEKKFATPLRKAMIDEEISRSPVTQLRGDRQRAYRLRMAMENLKKTIKVEPIRDTNLFYIKARDFSPVGAALIANAVSRSYVVFDLEQQFVDLQAKYTEKNPIVIQMRENIDKMAEGLSGQPLSNIDALGPASVKIIEQSVPPTKPEGMPKKTTLLMAIFMSVVLGVILAFMIEFADQTFHSKQDIEGFLGYPVIACINKKKGLFDKRVIKDVTDKNRSPQATSYRILSQQILFMAKSRSLKTFLFSGIYQKDQSAVTLANIGVFLSKKMGLRVLLVDANLRRPALHKLFGTQVDRGIAEILEGKIEVVDAIRPAGDKLWLIPSGRTHIDPAVLLDSTTFSRFVSDVRDDYDIVLMDGADLRDFRDSAQIGPAVDGLMLVIGESNVRRQVVMHAVQPVRDNHTFVAGVVMNNRHYVLPKFLYNSV